MKKFAQILALLFILVISITITSCKKDDVEEKTENCKMGEFSFKLNGENWIGETFNNTLIFQIDPQTGEESLRCDIRATNSEGNQMILTFGNPNATDLSCVETGSYIPPAEVTSMNDNTFIFTYLNSSNSIIFGTLFGTLNIEDCMSNEAVEITGTFDFKDTTETYEGTEGQFSVCIQK